MEIKNKFAKQVLKHFPVYYLLQDEPKYLVINYNWGDKDIVVKFTKNYYDFVGATLILPLQEQENGIKTYYFTVNYNYFSTEPEPARPIDPKKLLFFSGENRKAVALRLDMAVMFFFYDLGVGVRFEEIEVKTPTNCTINVSAPYINIRDSYSLVDSFTLAYKQLDEVPTIFIRSENILDFLGMYKYTGIVPLAIYVVNGKRFVLFKAEKYSPKIVNIPERVLEMTYIKRTTYNIKCLGDFIPELKDFYIADEEAYKLVALQFLCKKDTKTQRIKVRINEKEIEGKVRVGKFGDVVIITEEATYIVITKDSRETAEVIDKITSKGIEINEYYITTTNPRAFYVEVFRCLGE